jgi:hypothetical protein
MVEVKQNQLALSMPILQLLSYHVCILQLLSYHVWYVCLAGCATSANQAVALTYQRNWYVVGRLRNDCRPGLLGCLRGRLAGTVGKLHTTLI